MKTEPHIDSIGYLFVKICKARRNKANEMLVKFGIHAGQDVLLYCLNLEDGQTISELVNFVGVQHATISNMISRMVTSGLVNKIKEKNDKRVTRIFLTEKGKDAFIQVKNVWELLEFQTVDGLSEEEKMNLKKLLKKVLINFP